MPIAITREVSRAIAACELTHLARAPIDVGRARAQHEAYCAALAELGCEVRRLPEEPALADSVFVEDTALALDGLCVLMRPGAASRRPEVDSVAGALAGLRPLARLAGPGTVDGGDVLVLGREVHVGLSTRSTRAGIDELARLLAPHDYRVRATEVHGCLHLKSAATALGEDTVLVNPAWLDPRALGEHRVLEVDPGEPFAANALRVGAGVIHAAAFPRTRARLEAAGFRVVPVPADELAKAEGGVTCCSLILDDPR